MNYLLDNYDCAEDYQFRNVNMVIKNDIRAGHELEIKVLDANAQPITCLFQLDMYKKLSENRATDQDIILFSTTG